MKGMISADSHITEAPGTYVDYIDKKYKDTGAAHRARPQARGRLRGGRIPASAADWAGRPRPAKKPRNWAVWGAKFENLHRWRLGSGRPACRTRTATASPPKSLYPSVGMSAVQPSQVSITKRRASTPTICGWPSTARRIPNASSAWVKPRCASVAEGIEDLRKMKALGFRGVMLPGNPGIADYDGPDV